MEKLKKETLQAILCAGVALVLTVCTLFGVYMRIIPASAPHGDVPLVVIDAGHGGRDPGATGISTGTHECDANLSYARELKKLFESAGIAVIMTRPTDKPLYDEDLNHGYKDQDMKRRRAIIDAAAPDMVISVHMNFFPDPSAKGIAVFYKQRNDVSRCIAAQMEGCFNAWLADDTRIRVSAAGDYYILESAVPSILVEFGFMSNPEDDRLLANASYRERSAWCVFNSAVNFLRCGIRQMPSE